MKITDELKAQIADLCRQEAEKASQRQFAQRIGVSDATVSKLTAGNWADISDAMWRKFAQFFGLESWAIVKTANYATIHAVCEDAQARHRMRVVSGATGTGKTTALEKYCLRPDVRNAFYVLVTASMNEKELVRRIARACGIQGETTTYGFLEAIAAQLNRLDHPLLIIDDAGKLKDRKLLLLQQIRDMTETNAGIVLGSVDYLYDNLHRGATRNRVGFPELLSRLGRFQALSRPTKAEVRAICTHNGIDDEQIAAHIYAHSQDYRQVKDAVLDLLHIAATTRRQLTLSTAQEVLQ